MCLVADLFVGSRGFGRAPFLSLRSACCPNPPCKSDASPLSPPPPPSQQDVSKGIQTQTAECIVVGEITTGQVGRRRE